MERKGVVFKTLYMPSKIKIEVEKIDDNQWSIYYRETVEGDLPQEAIQFTLAAIKRLGVNAKKRGNTFSYKFTGSIEQIAGVISGEFLAYTNLGKLTIIEMLALAAIGLPKITGIQNSDKKASHEAKEH